jgi:hypothetical protein
MTFTAFGTKVTQYNRVSPGALMLGEQAVSTRLEDRAAQRLSPKSQLVPRD